MKFVKVATFMMRARYHVQCLVEQLALASKVMAFYVQTKRKIPFKIKFC